MQKSDVEFELDLLTIDALQNSKDKKIVKIIENNDSKIPEKDDGTKSLESKTVVPKIEKDNRKELEKDSYSSEKFDTFKQYAKNVAAFFKYGIHTKKYLEKLDDAEEEKKVLEMAEINVFDGEIQYDPEFEEQVKEIFNIKTTYRNLYSHLVVFIENNLRNTEEGIAICNANLVKNAKEYENFADIIFSMIRAAIDTKEISYENVLKTTNYLNVSPIIVQGLFSNEVLLKQVIDFTTTISTIFFEDEEKIHKVNEYSEKVGFFDKEVIFPEIKKSSTTISKPTKEPDILEPSINIERKQNYVNIYQEVFTKYGDNVVIVDEQQKVLVDTITEEVVMDEEKIEQHEVACTWYCLVCKTYNKKVLSSSDWIGLSNFLECIKESPKEKFPKGILESAYNYGFDKKFVNEIISIDELFRVFVNHVRNNIIRSLVAEQELSLKYKK
ncbi:MAG: hypothetical protein ACI31M_04235 [Bacilli bacterium]